MLSFKIFPGSFSCSVFIIVLFLDPFLRVLRSKLPSIVSEVNLEELASASTPATSISTARSHFKLCSSDAVQFAYTFRPTPSYRLLAGKFVSSSTPFSSFHSSSSSENKDDDDSSLNFKAFTVAHYSMIAFVTPPGFDLSHLTNPPATGQDSSSSMSLDQFFSAFSFSSSTSSSSSSSSQ